MQKKIFLLPARPLRIITMFAVSLLLALPSGADEAAEGRTLIDWYSQVPSVGVHNVYFQLRKDAKHLIVDSQTDSPSPFPEGREALFIQSGGDPGAFAAITMDPFFQDTHPPKGWMEIDFAVTRMIGIELSVDSSTEESPASHPDHDGRSLFNLLLNPDFAVLIRKEG